MDSAALPWLLAGVTMLAVGLLSRVATEGGRTRALREEADVQRKQARALQKQLDQGAKRLRKAEAELARHSHETARARKRAADAKGGRGERARTHSRVVELEQQALATADEIARLREELEQARVAAAAADDRIARARDQVARRAAEEQAVLVEDRHAREEQAQTLEARVRELETALGEERESRETAQTEAARLKAKSRTQETLYVSIRGELAARKDEVRQQREELERLRAYKVALVDAGAGAVADGDDAPTDAAGSPSADRSLG